MSNTRQQLIEIPEYATQIPHSLIPALNGGGDGPRPAPSSRPPLNIDLLDLIAGRELDYWVMLAIDEMFEQNIEPANVPSSRNPSIADNCAWLAANVDWIAEHNVDVPEMTNRKTGKTIPAFTGFTTAISQLHAAYKRAAGEQPGPKLTCPTCDNQAFIDGIWLVCREVEDHARTIKSIENEYRFAAAVNTAAILQQFTITEERIYQWKRRGKLRPARKEGRHLYWWPWDVFCLLNPHVAEAIATRDSITA